VGSRPPPIGDVAYGTVQFACSMCRHYVELVHERQRSTACGKILSTHANIEMNDIVLVHVRDALTDLTQPTDTLQLGVAVRLNDSLKQVHARHPQHMSQLTTHNQRMTVGIQA